MNVYKSSGFRSVQAECIHEAAKIFAARLAQKAYGKTAHSRVTVNSWSPDGNAATYQVFIGRHDRHSRTTSGRNEWLVVSRVVENV
jgi:hypothetical protein